MIEIEPEWKLCVLVCTNSRGPETGKPSCGEQRGSELRDAIKDLRTQGGHKGTVLVSKVGCLGVCSPRGVTVCAVTVDGRREAWVVEDGDSPAAVWAKVGAFRRAALT